MGDFKCILLSGRSQSEEGTYCRIPTMLYYGKGKIMDTTNRSGVGRNWESERGINRQRKEDVKAVKLIWLILPW